MPYSDQDASPDSVQEISAWVNHLLEELRGDAAEIAQQSEDIQWRFVNSVEIKYSGKISELPSHLSDHLVAMRESVSQITCHIAKLAESIHVISKTLDVIAPLASVDATQAATLTEHAKQCLADLEQKKVIMQEAIKDCVNRYSQYWLAEKDRLMSVPRHVLKTERYDSDPVGLEPPSLTKNSYTTTIKKIKNFFDYLESDDAINGLAEELKQTIKTSIEESKQKLDEERKDIDKKVADAEQEAKKFLDGLAVPHLLKSLGDYQTKQHDKFQKLSGGSSTEQDKNRAERYSAELSCEAASRLKRDIDSARRTLYDDMMKIALDDKSQPNRAKQERDAKTKFCEQCEKIIKTTANQAEAWRDFDDDKRLMRAIAVTLLNISIFLATLSLSAVATGRLAMFPPYKTPYRQIKTVDRAVKDEQKKMRKP